MKQIIYLLLIIFFISATSCTVDDQCRKDRTVEMIVGFHKKTIDSTTYLYTTSALSVDSLTVQGMDTLGTLIDSVLYKNVTASIISLPLNKFVNKSKFLITFKHITDTVSVLHTNTDVFLSLECGCLKVHSIDTVLTTNHYIDSVKISLHNVLNGNTTNAENLQIYKTIK
jgi:hypothetical protein